VPGRFGREPRQRVEGCSSGLNVEYEAGSVSCDLTGISVRVRAESLMKGDCPAKSNIPPIAAPKALNHLFSCALAVTGIHQLFPYYLRVSVAPLFVVAEVRKNNGPN
jgi:hypothetical protein